MRLAVLMQTLLLTALVQGCVESESEHAKKKGAIEAACVPVGNDSARHYCATTYIQLLANPDRYNGIKIQVHAWAVHGNNSTILYPSEDSMLGAETNATIILLSGPELIKISEYLESREDHAARVIVGGTFRVIRRDGRHESSSLEVGRFGVLQDVDLFFGN